MLATDTDMSINKLKHEPEEVFVELAAIDYEEAILYQWYREERGNRKPQEKGGNGNTCNGS